MNAQPIWLVWVNIAGLRSPTLVFDFEPKLDDIYRELANPLHEANVFLDEQSQIKVPNIEDIKKAHCVKRMAMIRQDPKPR